jgi:hypothetical protein
VSFFPTLRAIPLAQIYACIRQRGLEGSKLLDSDFAGDIDWLRQA